MGLKYGVGQLGPVENVLMWVARIYLGVGSLHPLVSLHFDMDLLISCTNKPAIYILERAVHLLQ